MLVSFWGRVLVRVAVGFPVGVDCLLGRKVHHKHLYRCLRGLRCLAQSVDLRWSSGLMTRGDWNVRNVVMSGSVVGDPTMMTMTMMMMMRIGKCWLGITL